MQTAATTGKRQGRAVRLLAALLLIAGVFSTLPIARADAQTRPRPRPDFSAGPDAPKTRPAPRPNAAAKPAPPKQLGAVTKQPLPRYVSLKGGEGNARRGPGLTHRIDWVFTTKGTPLLVTAEYENWRRVEDFEGFGGWVHFTLLSVARTVLITQDMAQFHTLPDPISPVAFQAERGVLGRVIECHLDWCRINADGQRGWAPKAVMWGVDSEEMIE
jgi:SH3-like domain-containing protein